MYYWPVLAPAAMGARSRERARFYSWNRVGRQVLSYYERLIYERKLVEREDGAPLPVEPR